MVEHLSNAIHWYAIHAWWRKTSIFLSDSHINSTGSNVAQESLLADLQKFGIGYVNYHFNLNFGFSSLSSDVCRMERRGIGRDSSAVAVECTEWAGFDRLHGLTSACKLLQISCWRWHSAHQQWTARHSARGSMVYLLQPRRYEPSLSNFFCHRTADDNIYYETEIYGEVVGLQGGFRAKFRCWFKSFIDGFYWDFTDGLGWFVVLILCVAVFRMYFLNIKIVLRPTQLGKENAWLEICLFSWIFKNISEKYCSLKLFNKQSEAIKAIRFLTMWCTSLVILYICRESLTNNGNLTRFRSWRRPV